MDDLFTLYETKPAKMGKKDFYPFHGIFIK